MTETHEDRLNRLRYRSWHRGCKETDLILGSYCDAHLKNLDTHTLDAYEQLLDEDDAHIWAWLTDKETPPTQKYDAILEKLRHFRSYAPVA